MTSPATYLQGAIVKASTIESARIGVASGHIDPVETVVYLVLTRAVHRIETVQWFMENVGLLGKERVYRCASMAAYVLEHYILMFGNYPIFCSCTPIHMNYVSQISATGRNSYSGSGLGRLFDHDRVLVFGDRLYAAAETATGYDYRRYSAMLAFGMSGQEAFFASVEIA